MRGPHRVYDARAEAGYSSPPHTVLSCGAPDCAATLLRVLPDGLERISAVLICWKCGANNIAVVEPDDAPRCEEEPVR